MHDKLKITGYWLLAGIALLASAYLATEAAFWATGRGGSVPCGEDGWRWGLMHLVLGVPMLFFGHVAGLMHFIVFRVRIRVRTMAAFGYSFGLQFLTAIAVSILLTWPHIFYNAPICE